MTKLLADCQYLRPRTSSESPAVQIPRYSQSSFLLKPQGTTGVGSARCWLWVWTWHLASKAILPGALRHEQLSIQVALIFTAAIVGLWHVKFLCCFGAPYPGRLCRVCYYISFTQRATEKGGTDKHSVLQSPPWSHIPSPSCGSAAAGVPLGAAKGTGKARIAGKQSRAAGPQEVLDCLSWGWGNETGLAGSVWEEQGEEDENMGMYLVRC